MRKITLIVLAAALGGCVSAKPVPLPGGVRGYVVDRCDSLAKCYKAAAKQCGDYEIISETASSNFLEPVYTVTFKCP